jgi:hypothetical protein
VIRTTNKKYYKRFDIPDLKRLGIKLDEGNVAWKYQHNTLIIGYDKPDKILELDKKKQQEIANLAKQQASNPFQQALNQGIPPPSNPKNAIEPEVAGTPDCK